LMFISIACLSNNVQSTITHLFYQCHYDHYSHHFISKWLWIALNHSGTWFHSFLESMNYLRIACIPWFTISKIDCPNAFFYCKLMLPGFHSIMFDGYMVR
jgi:hypothetical protein